MPIPERFSDIKINILQNFKKFIKDEYGQEKQGVINLIEKHIVTELSHKIDKSDRKTEIFSRQFSTLSDYASWLQKYTECLREIFPVTGYSILYSKKDLMIKVYERSELSYDSTTNL